MNSVNIIGNLSVDPKLFGNDENKVVKFTVAVQRNYTNANGEKESDFLACTAFEKTAELIDKYLAKGSKVGVSGSLQNNEWTDKEGNKQSKTGINVEQITFLDNKETSESLMKRRQADASKQETSQKSTAKKEKTVAQTVASEEDPF